MGALEYILELVFGPPQLPRRVCRKCFIKASDQAVYYRFTTSSPCSRCNVLTEARDSVGLE